MDQVFGFINRHYMIKESDKIIVGVSGGADSVCLLFLLKEYQKQAPFIFDLVVVHVEHGLRGVESIEDSQFVEHLCERLEVPFYLIRANVKAHAKASKMSVEEAGRELRYQAFTTICTEVEGTKIAVAHNANDQAETVLWNLIRGSGVRGLGGIHPRNETIIRPLLEVSRAEIEAWLEQRNITYRVDRTNLEETYTRNKLRLKVLPYLGELNTHAAEHIAQTAMGMQQAEAYLEGQAKKSFQKIGKLAEKEVYLDREAFLAEEELIQEYLIRCSIKMLGVPLKNLSRIHVNDMKNLAAGHGGTSLNLPRGLRFCNWGKTLCVTAKPEEELLPQEATEVLVPGELIWRSWRVITTLERNKNQRIPEKKYTKWFDYDKIKDTIQIRGRQAGDYFIADTLGGRKKLKDYFINEKIPRPIRAQIPLLAEGSHVIWCIGYRISEAYKVSEGTENILKVQFLEERDGG